MEPERGEPPLYTCSACGEAGILDVEYDYAAIRATPAVLAVLLGAMAAATVAHLLIMVVRTRRRELALCSALGMTSADIIQAILIQGAIIAAIALIVGIPIGAITGRAAA